MMNSFNGFFMASFTNSIGSFDCLSSSLSPVYTIGNRTATLPFSVIFTNIKFREPFSFALIVTECFVTMKITCGTCYVFTTPRTLTSFTIASTWIGFTYPMFIVTLFRTILLSTIARISYIPSTMTEFIRGCLPEPSHSVTFQIAIFRVWTAIKRVIFLAANLTNQCNSITSSIFNSHTSLYHTRDNTASLSQSVLQLEIPKEDVKTETML